MSDSASSGNSESNDIASKNATESDHVRNWLRDNVTWLLGVVPIAYASIRIILVARGDRATIATLLTNLDVISLILGTVLPVITTAIFYASAAGILLCIKDFSKNTVNTMLIRGYGILVLTVLFAISLGLSSPLVAMILLGGFLGTALMTWWADGFKKIRFMDARVALLTSIVTVVIPIVSTDMWLPAEVLIETYDHTASIIYVIDSDDDALTVFEDGRGVRRIAVEEIESRVICNAEDTDTSIIDRLNRDVERTPTCESLLPRTDVE